jgi:hypothetical protein
MAGVVALVLFGGMARADWVDRFGPVALVTVSEVRDNPLLYLESVVRLEARFDRFGRLFNPVYTRFVDERYVNFSAWGEEQPLWEQEEYADPYPYFYFDKGHPEIKTLHDLERYESIELLCFVRDIFRGRVWIDVVGIRRLDNGVVSDRILSQIVRGREHFRAQRWDGCLGEFKDARQARLPVAYAARLQLDIALVYAYKKGPAFRQAAEVELRRAVELNPDHIHLRRLHGRVSLENRLAREEKLNRKTRHGSTDPSSP